MRELLGRIQEGMAVYDRTNEKIGTVRDVYLGAEPGAATAPETPAPHSFVDDIAAALAGPGRPDVVRSRLRREGFIRIDVSGPFAGDRYAFGSQIRDVAGDAVQLDATRDELVA
jgi:hypothetical protein